MEQGGIRAEEKAMSRSETAPKLLVVLTEDNDPHRIVVDMRSFLRFSQEVTSGLEDLVDEWYSMAAPMSGGAALRRAALNNKTLDM